MNYPVVPIMIGAVLSFLAATFTGQLIARARFPLPPGDRRIGCIDGLRGYLALSVMIHHFIVWMQATRLGGVWGPLAIPLFEQFGIGAVALFFMITGLLFYPRILAGFRAVSWPAVYIGRLFRILPLAIVSVIVITVIIAFRTGRSLDRDFPGAFVMWVSGKSEPPLLGYPDSALLNAYVLWSLWFEWLFYIFVLPACALVTDRIRGLLPSWVVPAILIAAAVLLRPFHASVPLLTYLPLFAVGMLAFECRRRESLARLLRGRWASVIALASLSFGMAAFSSPNAFALPFLAFFFTCVACGNTMGGLLQTRGALVLGECSYGIYLLHGIVLNLLFVAMVPLTRRFSNDWLPMLLPPIAIVVVLITAVTYLLIERPALQAGRRLVKAGTGRRQFR